MASRKHNWDRSSSASTWINATSYYSGWPSHPKPESLQSRLASLTSSSFSPPLFPYPKSYLYFILHRHSSSFYLTISCHGHHRKYQFVSVMRELDSRHAQFFCPERKFVWVWLDSLSHQFHGTVAPSNRIQVLVTRFILDRQGVACICECHKLPNILTVTDRQPYPARLPNTPCETNRVDSWVFKSTRGLRFEFRVEISNSLTWTLTPLAVMLLNTFMLQGYLSAKVTRWTEQSQYCLSKHKTNVTTESSWLTGLNMMESNIYPTFYDFYRSIEDWARCRARA